MQVAAVTDDMHEVPLQRDLQVTNGKLKVILTLLLTHCSRLD